MNRVMRFRAADLRLIDGLAEQLGELAWDKFVDVGPMLERAGNAFTIWQGSGETRRPVFCGGAVERHPGYASLWSVHGKGRGAYFLFVTRATQRFLETLRYGRVDTLVQATDGKACRWALRLGLRPEAVLERAAPDGSDMLVMVK